MVSPAALVVGVVASLGGLVGSGVAYVAWRHRDHPAAVPFAKQAVLSSLWAFVFVGIVFVRDPVLAEVLIAATGVFGLLTVNYFLQFSVVYTGRQEWLTPLRRRALLGFYVAVALVTIVDPVTHLLIRDVTLRTVDGLTLPVAERTLAYVVTVGMAYSGILVGLGLLARFVVSARNVYRTQTAIIFAAICFGVLGSVVFQTGLSPHPGLDLTPVFYAIEAVVIALALFTHDFLDVEPLAPDVVLTEIEDPVLVLDETGTLVDVNPAARPLFDGTDPVGEDLEAVLPGLLEAAESGDEFEHARAAAEAVDVYDLNRAPIRDQYDRERGSVVVLRDITIQKRRERTLEELQTVNQRFLAAETPAAVCAVAVEAASHVLGYRYSGALLYDEDVDGLRTVALTDPLFEAFGAMDADRPACEVSRLDGDETVTVPVVRRGGGDVWAVYESGEPMLGRPLEAGEGRSLGLPLGGSLLFPLGEHGVLGISAGADHDGFSEDDRRFARTLAAATESALDRVAKEAQLRESRELLERRTEQIEFFNSVLRHDLLNGMMVVQARLELLEEHVDPAGRTHLETVEEYSDDIATLARKVRSVTKTVTGETDIDLEPVDLHAAVTRKADKLRGSYDGAHVAADVDPDLRVRADDLLPEVVENLLLNAIEHNDAADPEVRVRSVRTDDGVEVRIADNGPGIPDGMKEAVFEERVTSEDSGSVGFGLYFVKVMMDLYGGDVWFEDRERGDGRGTVAVLSFPADAVTVAPDAGAGSPAGDAS